MVTVSTNQKDGKIVVRVKDNGPGIPNDIKEKIFRPFFTTKPTGEGLLPKFKIQFSIKTINLTYIKK